MTESERKLLPQLRSALQQFLNEHRSERDRDELAHNSTPVNTHWRHSYTHRDDLPYLYALRDHLANPSQPMQVLDMETFQRRYPPHYGVWPIDCDTLPDRLLIRFLRARTPARRRKL